MISCGSSRPDRRLPRIITNNTSGFNTLPDPKPSLITKPNGSYIASPATKPSYNAKKVPHASTKLELIQTRRFASGSGTSVPAANPSKKRSISASTVSDNYTPPTKKRPIDTNTDITSSSPTDQDAQDAYPHITQDTTDGSNLPSAYFSIYHDRQDNFPFVLNSLVPLHHEPFISYSPVREYPSTPNPQAPLTPEYYPSSPPR